jgi:spore germination protein KC
MKRLKGKEKRVKKGLHLTLWATLIFACLVGLSGCWDLQEVDRRSFVTSMGIDIDQKGNTALMIQLPLPERMMPSSSSTTPGQPSKRFSTASISAPTVNEALNILQTETYRELVIEQNKSVIISEAAASRGIWPLIEFFIRNPKAPPQALLFIAHHHTARDILTFSPIQETLPGLEFIGAAQSAVKYDRTYFIAIGQFAPKAIHIATDAYAPLIDFDQKSGMYIEAGLAVFDGFHLAGELDMDEAQCYGLLSGLMQAGNLTLNLPDQGYLSLRNVRGKPSIKVLTSKEGAPYFLVKINVNGSLSDLANSHQELSPKNERELELGIQKVLVKKITAVIQKLQSDNSDIINFGEELRVQHLDVWKQLKWKQTFPKVSFQVVVKAKIERGGVLR